MYFKSFRTQTSHRILTFVLIGALSPVGAAFAADVPVFKPASDWNVGATQLSSVRGLNVKLPCVVSNEYDNGFVVRFSGGGGTFLAMAVDFRQGIFKQGRQYDTLLSVGDSYAKQVKATAFTDSTLIFNLRPLPDMYGAIKGGKTMGLDIDGNVMTFELGALAPALASLESCYAGTETPPAINSMAEQTGAAPAAKVESMPVEPVAPPPAVAQKELPRTFDEIMKGAETETQPAPAPAPAQKTAQKGMTPMVEKTPENPAPVKEIPGRESARMDVESEPLAPPVAAKKTVQNAAAKNEKPSSPMKIATPGLKPVAKAEAPKMAAVESAPIPLMREPAEDIAPVQNAAPVKPAPAAPHVWEAKAGEDMKIVLSRWATQAGYDLDWQSTQDGKVAQDMRMSGPFDQAVTQLLAENGAASGIAGQIETSDGYTKDLKRADAAPAPVATPAAARTVPAANWSAQRGANIQGVVDGWAKKAGVKVIWQSYMSIPVKAPVQLSGSFEEAVGGLLDQYATDSTRPVGQLNTDPETGERTLLMNLDKSGV